MVYFFFLSSTSNNSLLLPDGDSYYVPLRMVLHTLVCTTEPYNHIVMSPFAFECNSCGTPINLIYPLKSHMHWWLKNKCYILNYVVIKWNSKFLWSSHYIRNIWTVLWSYKELENKEHSKRILCLHNRS